MTAQTHDEALSRDLADLGLSFPEDATLGTPAHDDSGMAGKPWTEDAMLRVLWRHFLAQSWSAIPQVTISERDLDPDHARLSAWDARRQDRDAATDRRIDMLCVRKPRKADLGAFESLAIEVKVTRADFLSDVKNPAKQAAWRKAATRHTYAVPAGLVSADEVPEGSGLLAVKSHGAGGWGTVEWVKRAPYVPRHAPQLPPRAMIALLYRITSLEGHTRGWHTGPDAAGTPQELRAAAQAANKGAERAEKARAKAEAQRDAWKHAYGLVSPDGHPCRWCGRPVKPLNPGADGFRSWRHRDQADDEPCALAETAVREDEARQEYDAATESERGYKVRAALAHSPAHRVDEVERDPWRAFVPVNYRDYRTHITGAQPANVLPEGADQ